MLHTLAKYTNNNTTVTLATDGTKIRSCPPDKSPQVFFPESVDLKITQYCDMANICVYCHEMSNKKGKHGDLRPIVKLWKNSQQPGTEIAIGGGNPMSHPHLREFLEDMTESGFICNLTVNILHFRQYGHEVTNLQNKKLIRGLGISYRSGFPLNNLLGMADYSNVVFHVILGINTFDEVMQIMNWCLFNGFTPKILLLGYKIFGNGVDFYSLELERKLSDWRHTHIQRLLDFDNLVLAFDNLAIEQLDLEHKFSKEEWDTMYQGSDGSHTCYIDAVNMEIARSSTATERFKIREEDTMQTLFQKVCSPSH